MPKEKSTSIAPTATADPLEEPPEILLVSYGFLVGLQESMDIQQYPLYCLHCIICKWKEHEKRGPKIKGITSDQEWW